MKVTITVTISLMVMKYHHQFRLEFSHIVDIYAVGKIGLCFDFHQLQINTESSKEFNEDIVESEIQEPKSKSENSSASEPRGRKRKKQIPLEVITEKRRKIKNEKTDLIIEAIPGPSTSKESDNSDVKDPNQNQSVQKSVSVKKETVEKSRRGTKRNSEPITKKESAKASRSSTSTNSNQNPKPTVRRTISTITGMHIVLIKCAI